MIRVVHPGSGCWLSTRVRIRMVPLTNGSRSGKPKNLWILRIRNTAFNKTRVYKRGNKLDSRKSAERAWVTLLPFLVRRGGHRHLQIGRMLDIHLISEPPLPPPPRCMYPNCGNLCGQRGRGLRMSHICPCTPCPSPQGYRSKVESRHFAHNCSPPSTLSIFVGKKLFLWIC